MFGVRHQHKYIEVRFRQADSVSAGLCIHRVKYDETCEKLFTSLLASAARFRPQALRAWKFYTTSTDALGEPIQSEWSAIDPDRPLIAHWIEGYPWSKYGEPLYSIDLFGQVK